MKVRKTPLRKCIGCNEPKTKDELIRIVKTKENEVFIDVSGKVNGRGSYICIDTSCLEKAHKRDSLSRAFKMKVDKELYEKLKKEIEDVK
ncbi:MAG: YlxR family protein [Acidaminobacteraceae bacterium]